MDDHLIRIGLRIDAATVFIFGQDQDPRFGYLIPSWPG
jgi:hypothetical protein